MKVSNLSSAEYSVNSNLEDLYAPDEYKYLQRYISGTTLTTSVASQEDWETQTWVDYNVVSTSDESRADILNAFGAQNKALLEYNRPLTFAYDSSIKAELKSHLNAGSEASSPFKTSMLPSQLGVDSETVLIAEFEKL